MRYIYIFLPVSSRMCSEEFWELFPVCALLNISNARNSVLLTAAVSIQTGEGSTVATANANAIVTGEDQGEIGFLFEWKWTLNPGIILFQTYPGICLHQILHVQPDFWLNSSWYQAVNYIVNYIAPLKTPKTAKFSGPHMEISNSFNPESFLSPFSRSQFKSRTSRVRSRVRLTFFPLAFYFKM